MIRSAIAAVACLWLMLVSTAARAETRVALVIGNGAYKHTARLANPENDARDVASALTAAGFQVFEAFNVEKRRLDGVLRAWADAIAKADVALFYYAGHGVQLGQQNYLLPVDAQLGKERDLEFEGVKVDFILRQMEIDREGKTNIVILDACRDNPLARNLAGSMGTRSASIGRGLGAAPAGLGMFIAYATQPGNVALDGAEGQRNSPFAKALVKEMLVKGRNINGTMGAVRRAVVEATRGQQVPWDHSSLTSDFFFVPTSPTAKATAATKDNEELAALKERLKKLEAEAQRRDAAPAGNVARLAELKARAGVLDDTVKDMQRKVLDARMREGRTTDPAEKQRLQREALTLQGDLARRSLELRRLRDEIVALDSTATDKKVGSPFVVQMDNRIIGTVMPAPPSTANCESRCLIETGCIGWNLSRDGICELLSAFVRREAASNWRSGLSPEATASVEPAAVQPPSIPPVTAKARSDASAADYETSESVRLTGTEIDTAFRTPSAAACREACDRTAACIGYQHGRKIPMSGQCHLFSGIEARHEDDRWRSGVRVRARTATDKTGSTAEQIVVPVAPLETRQGFALFSGVRIDGSSIKLTRETTIEGCITVCRNTPNCIAGTLDIKSQPARCRVLKSVSKVSTIAAGSQDTAPNAFVRADSVKAARNENAKR